MTKLRKIIETFRNQDQKYHQQDFPIVPAGAKERGKKIPKIFVSIKPMD